MKTKLFISDSMPLLALCLALTQAPAQTPPGLNITLTDGLPRINITGTTSALCQIQYVTEFAGSNNWLCLTNLAVTSNPCFMIDTNAAGSTSRFYRLMSVLPSLAFVPGGPFAMGDTLVDLADDELPVHTLNVSAFYIERMEVSKALWNIVCSWATNNGNGYGYGFSANAGLAKAINHPATTVNWHDAVKWCNARSQLEGLTPVYYTDAALTQIYTSGQVTPYANWSASGYRLPTEAEWEKAARGGAAGYRFPWTDTNIVTHSRANYYSQTGYAYDTSPTRGYNPAFTNGFKPYTSPCGYFSTNGFGLYDMAGNAQEWCWDWYDQYWYTNAAASLDDTRGPSSGTYRVLRGGSWDGPAPDVRCAGRERATPASTINENGFRCVKRP